MQRREFPNDENRSLVLSVRLDEGLTLDLRTARAWAGVRITAYNDQLWVNGSGTTDVQVFTDFDSKDRLHAVTASDDV